MPPAIPKITSLIVVPIGTSTNPVKVTFPERANTFVPLLFSVPIDLKFSNPFGIISGRQDRVSTLLITVGFPNNPFTPQDNTEYELTVIYDSQTYKGKATRIKTTPLTKVVQGDKTLFSGKETELEVYFTDTADREDFYLFDFTNNLFLTVEDRFFNGSEYNFSFFYGEVDIELPATVSIKMSGISKEYYTYFRVLLDQSGLNDGGPFETVPSSLLGNIINITNEENFPLGYFHIAETSSYNVKLIEKN